MYRDSKTKSKETKDSSLLGSLSLNKLRYQMAERLSTATKRQHRKAPFNKRTYEAGETARCIVNSGTDYLDWRTSYLKVSLDVTPVGADPAVSYTDQLNFGRDGSALNLISEIVIRARDGTEVVRIPQFGKVMSQWIVSNYSKDWLSSIGVAAGFPVDREDLSKSRAFVQWTPDSGAPTVSTETSKKSKSQTFCIPMELLGGFFRPYGNVLCPSALASGLEIQLTFADFGTAFTNGDGNGKTTNDPVGENTDVPGEAENSWDQDWTYNITELTLNLDSVSLADAAAAELVQQCSRNGLEYVYPTLFTSSSTLAQGISNIDINIAKSVSVAKRCYFMYHTGGAGDRKVDNMSSPNNIARYRFRLGSTYLPSDIISTPISTSMSGSCENYLLSAISYGKVKDVAGPANTLEQFIDLKGGSSTCCSLLRDSNQLALTGLPLSNARQLNIEIELDTAPADPAGGVIITALEYEVCLRVYLNNCVLKL